MGGNVFEETKHFPLATFLHRRIQTALLESDRILVDGRDLVASLRHRGIPEDRFRILYQGIDPEAYRESNPARNFFPERKNEDSFRIVWHGRLAEHHGPDRFLQVAKRIPDCIGRFGGSGVPTGEIKESMEDPSFEGWFLGALSKQDLIGLLKSADCGIYPLRKMAGIPTVLLEAMAAGLPVVTLRTGACDELIENGKNGFISENIGEMVRTANRLRIDRDLRRAISSSAQETIVRSWSEAASLRNLESILEDWLNR
jgi:glycosyltransferase involved in cell wall biosynthesis